MNADQLRARRLILEYGWNAVAYQILNPGFNLWFSRAGNSVVGYVRRSGRWVIAGAPVCDPGILPDVIEELELDARADGCKTCYFGAALRMYEGCRHPPRHSVISLGSQPVWDPHRWSDILAAKASIRAQINRAHNKGVTVREWTDQGSFTVQQMRTVLNAWLAAKPMPPMHFLVEPDTLSFLEDRIVMVAARGDTLEGYLVASPIPARNGWLVEQIIRRPGAPNGTNEFLVHAAMTLLAGRNANYVTLGLVPLAQHYKQGEPENPFWLSLLFKWGRAHGRRFYNFQGLESFKAKFLPDAWEPIYAIATEPHFSLRTLWAIAASFSNEKSPLIHGTQALATAVRHEARQLFR